MNKWKRFGINRGDFVVEKLVDCEVKAGEKVKKSTKEIFKNCFSQSFPSVCHNDLHEDLHVISTFLAINLLLDFFNLIAKNEV